MTKRTAKNTKPGSTTIEEEHDIIIGARQNSAETVKGALEQDPSCINRQGDGGLTALHWTCGNRNWEIFELLMEQTIERADPWIEDIMGTRPVDLAIDRHADVLVTRLFQLMYPD